MPEPIYIVMLLGGLVALAIAGDLLVNGAVSLGRSFGLSPLFAGVVIVGFGTSLPEVALSLDAAISGLPEIAHGNIVGSNIANMWLVLGLPMLFATLSFGAADIERTLWAALVATAAWIVVTALGPLNRTVGIVFVIAIVAYVFTVLTASRKAASAGGDVSALIDDLPDPMPLPKASVFAAIGIIGLPFGAHLMIEGAVGVADYYGVPDRVVGLTLLAFGTSLPEIAAALAAALRKHGDVIIGNVLGSNLFNILAAGGLVALVSPGNLDPAFNAYDHWFMALSIGLVGLAIQARLKLGFVFGLVFLLMYSVYITGVALECSLVTRSCAALETPLPGAP